MENPLHYVLLYMMHYGWIHWNIVTQKNIVKNVKQEDLLRLK